MLRAMTRSIITSRSNRTRRTRATNRLKPAGPCGRSGIPSTCPTYSGASASFVTVRFPDPSSPRIGIGRSPRSRWPALIGRRQFWRRRFSCRADSPPPIIFKVAFAILDHRIWIEISNLGGTRMGAIQRCTAESVDDRPSSTHRFQSSWIACSGSMSRYRSSSSI